MMGEEKGGMELISGFIKIGGVGIWATNEKIKAYSPTYIHFSSTRAFRREVIISGERMSVGL